MWERTVTVASRGSHSLHEMHVDLTMQLYRYTDRLYYYMVHLWLVKTDKIQVLYLTC